MTYSVTSSQQVTTFFMAMGLGFILGAVYYAVALVRKMISRSDMAVFVCDIIFGIIWSLFYFIFITVFSNGEIRFDQLFSVLVGFFVFVKVLGKSAEKYSDKFSHLFRRTVYFLLFPVRLILKLFKKAGSFFKKKKLESKNKRDEKHKRKELDKQKGETEVKKTKKIKKKRTKN